MSEGTAIAHPLRLAEALAAVRNTQGSTVAVEEEAIVGALKRIVLLGLLPELTSATAVAGFDRLAHDGIIRPQEETVVILTGTGIKNAGAIAELYG